MNQLTTCDYGRLFSKDSWQGAVVALALGAMALSLGASFCLALAVPDIEGGARGKSGANPPPAKPPAALPPALPVPPPSASTSKPAYPADVVFCIDVTEAGRNFDENGLRGAAALFSDALLPEGSRRAVQVFSSESRSLMSPSATPLAARPAPSDSNYALPYVLETPARGFLNPVKAMEKALEILEDSPSPRKAIFILLGHRLQISQAGELNKCFVQTASEIVPRCRMRHVRLYIAHRDRLAEIATLWNDLASATGGAAALAEDPADMMTTVMDWAAAFAGVFQMAPGDGDSLMSVRPGQMYAMAFSMAQDTPEIASQRFTQKRFTLEDEKSLITFAGLSLAIMGAETAGPQPLPIPSDRVLRVYSRINQRVTVTASPELVFSDSGWVVRVDMGLGSANLNATGVLPEIAYAQLRKVMPADSKEKTKTRIEPLLLGKDPVRKSLVYEARFEPPIEPGRYRLLIRPKPSTQSVEFLQMDARVYAKSIAALIAPEAGDGVKKNLALKATIPELLTGRPVLMATVQQDSAPLRGQSALCAGGRCEMPLSNDYSGGSVYRIALGALGTTENNAPAYVPGPIKQFPPSIASSEIPPIEIAKTSPAAVPSADLLAIPPLDVKRPKVEITEAAAPTTRSKARAALPKVEEMAPIKANAIPTPKVGEKPTAKAPAKPAAKVEAKTTTTAAAVIPAGGALITRSRDKLYFAVGSFALLLVILFLIVLGFKLGLFPGRMGGLQIASGARAVAGGESAPEDALRTQVIDNGPAAGKPELSPEDALKLALAQAPPRRELSEADLLGSPKTILEIAPAESIAPASSPSEPQSASPELQPSTDALAVEKGAPDAAKPLKRDEAKPEPFTEGDLLETLAKESLANPETKPAQSENVQAAQDLPSPKEEKPAAAAKSATAEGDLSLADLPKKEPAPVKKVEDDLPAGFLSQEDLDALLSGASSVSFLESEKPDGGGKK